MEKYKKVKKIGTGTYSDTYEVVNKETGEHFALKEIKGMEKQYSDIEKEIISSCQSDNIVKFIEAFDIPNGVAHVHELLTTTLGHYSSDSNYAYSPALLKSYAFQILCGLKYLHSHNIVHRNLSPFNILLSKNGLLKLSGFSLSLRLTTEEEVTTTPVVPLWYRAPELLLDAPHYGKPIDIWAAGCIIAELFKKETLLEGDSDLDQIMKIFKLFGTPTEAEWPGISELPIFDLEFEVFEKQNLSSVIGSDDANAVDLLQKMLTLDPSKRITAEEALNHPYFADLPDEVKHLAE